LAPDEGVVLVVGEVLPGTCAQERAKVGQVSWHVTTIAVPVFVRRDLAQVSLIVHQQRRHLCDGSDVVDQACRRRA
jgi:hypothetical protein